VSFTATAAYPYVDRDRATAGLRGQLRGIVAGAGAGVPDWTTLVVEGPTAIKGLSPARLVRLDGNGGARIDRTRALTPRRPRRRL
jgi:hypothetical protein